MASITGDSSPTVIKLIAVAKTRTVHSKKVRVDSLLCVVSRGSVWCDVQHRSLVNSVKRDSEYTEDGRDGSVRWRRCWNGFSVGCGFCRILWRGMCGCESAPGEDGGQVIVRQSSSKERVVGWLCSPNFRSCYLTQRYKLIAKVNIRDKKEVHVMDGCLIDLQCGCRVESSITVDSWRLASGITPFYYEEWTMC